MRANQRVTLEVPDSDPPVRYHSRIEGVEAEYLTLAAPQYHGASLPLRPGTQLRVTLFHASGAHAFETVVLARESKPTPVLLVERPKRLVALQRRQYFREPAVVKTLCGNDPDSKLLISGLTRNLGGGGVCLRTHDVKILRRVMAERSDGEPMWVEIILPGHPVQALAELTWCQISADDDHADLAFEFIDLADTERERLIRYLFTLQRDAIRKGF